MIKYFGSQAPHMFNLMRIGGICPHCRTAARYLETSHPDFKTIKANNHQAFIAAYSCDACTREIAVRWPIGGWQNDVPKVEFAELVLRSVEEFDFDHVPDAVKTELVEALDCLSVNAFNGFAALCRRTIQAISTNLGAEASAKVKNQIKEMIELAGLGPEWMTLAEQIMLTGHDGSHPHLPDVNQDRAAVLLSLVRDLTYQIYTRPGRVKAAAELRSKAVNEMKT